MTVLRCLSSRDTHPSFSWGPWLLALPQESCNNPKGLPHHITTVRTTLWPPGFLPVTRDQAFLSPGTIRPPAPASPPASQGLCSSNVSFSSAPFISLPLPECDAVPPILKNKKTAPSGHVFTQPLPRFSALPRKLLTHSPGSAAGFLTASCPNLLLFHQTRFIFPNLRALGFVQCPLVFHVLIHSLRSLTHVITGEKP